MDKAKQIKDVGSQTTGGRPDGSGKWQPAQGRNGGAYIPGVSDLGEKPPKPPAKPAPRARPAAPPRAAGGGGDQQQSPEVRRRQEGSGMTTHGNGRQRVRRESLQGHARDAEIAAKDSGLLNIAKAMTKRSEEQPITEADTTDFRDIERLLSAADQQAVAAHRVYENVHAEDDERVARPARGSDAVQQRGDVERNRGA